MSVKNHHRDYDVNEADWKRCRDFYKGSRAVKAASAIYLPKLSGQDDTEYHAYKDRALFYNATARTVGGLLGMVFRKSPQIVFPDLLDKQGAYVSDITLTSVPLELFAKDVTQEILTTGRCGVLVDVAGTEDGGEVTDARPYLAYYEAEHIINWRTARINGENVLVMVVLSETAEEADPEDPFKVNEIEQYRVLSLEGDGESRTYYSRIYRKADKDKEDSWAMFMEFVPKRRGAVLDFIPFVFLGPNTTTPDVDKSPILDLVDVNLSHYQTSADIEHGRHFTALPTVWVSGFDVESDLKIGSGTAWVTNNVNAKAGILEYTGQGLKALETALDEKESKMAALGARILEKQSNKAEAAETVRLRQAGEQSTLQGLANAISLGLTQALKWLTFWAGQDNADTSIRLNNDYFETDMDPARLRELVAVWQGGGMSKKTLYFNMQKGNITRPDVTFEQEQQEIMSEDSAFGMPPSPSAGGGGAGGGKSQGGVPGDGMPMDEA
jgi:hypothetical protein